MFTEHCSECISKHECFDKGKCIRKDIIDKWHIVEYSELSEVSDLSPIIGDYMIIFPSPEENQEIESDDPLNPNYTDGTEATDRAGLHE